MDRLPRERIEEIAINLAEAYRDQVDNLALRESKDSETWEGRRYYLQLKEAMMITENENGKTLYQIYNLDDARHIINLAITKLYHNTPTFNYMKSKVANLS